MGAYNWTIWLGLTWKLTGQQGWVEQTHLTYGGQADREYRLITYRRHHRCGQELHTSEIGE